MQVVGCLLQGGFVFYWFLFYGIEVFYYCFVIGVYFCWGLDCFCGYFFMILMDFFMFIMLLLMLYLSDVYDVM